MFLFLASVPISLNVISFFSFLIFPSLCPTPPVSPGEFPYRLGHSHPTLAWMSIWSEPKHIPPFLTVRVENKSGCGKGEEEATTSPAAATHLFCPQLWPFPPPALGWGMAALFPSHVSCGTRLEARAGLEDRQYVLLSLFYSILGSDLPYQLWLFLQAWMWLHKLSRNPRAQGSHHQWTRASCSSMRTQGLCLFC